MESLPYPIVWFAAYAATAAAVWTLFAYLESVLSTDARQWIAAWLKGVRPDSAAERWQSSLSHILERVFGRNPDSLSFIIRSCIASTAGVAITLIVWCAVRTEQLPSAWAYVSSSEELLIITLLVLVLNWCPDYFSLLESRWIINRMRTSSSKGTIGWLLVDFVATLMILFSTFVFVGLIAVLGHWGLYWLLDYPEPFYRAWDLHFGLRGTGGSYPLIWEVWLSGPILDIASSKFAPAGLLFYSTFFTSIWVWLFLAGGFLVRAARFLYWLISGGTRILDVDSKPVRSIGFGCVLIITVAYAIVPAFH